MTRRSSSCARALGFLVAALLCQSCATARLNPLCYPCDQLRQDDCVVFRVVHSRAERTDLPIPDAPIFLSRPAGLLFLGTSDAAAEFVVARRDLLAQSDPALLVFCWDHSALACTAVRLDLPNIARWDVFNVTLPPNPLDPAERALSGTLTIPANPP